MGPRDQEGGAFDMRPVRARLQCEGPDTTSLDLSHHAPPNQDWKRRGARHRAPLSLCLPGLEDTFPSRADHFIISHGLRLCPLPFVRLWVSGRDDTEDPNPRIRCASSLAWASASGQQPSAAEDRAPILCPEVKEGRGGDRLSPTGRHPDLLAD